MHYSQRHVIILNYFTLPRWSSQLVPIRNGMCNTDPNNNAKQIRAILDVD